VQSIFPAVVLWGALLACSGKDEEFLAGGEAKGNGVETETVDGEIVDGVFHAFGETYAVDELGSLSQALVPTSCAGTPPSVGTLTVSGPPGQNQILTTNATYGIPSCPKVARVDLNHFAVNAQVVAAYASSVPTNQTDCQKIEVSRVTMSNPGGSVVFARTRAFGTWGGSGPSCFFPITGSPTMPPGQHFEWVQALDQLGNTRQVRVTLIAL
jgi:hypothetical protein